MNSFVPEFLFTYLVISLENISVSIIIILKY